MPGAIISGAAAVGRLSGMMKQAMFASVQERKAMGYTFDPTIVIRGYAVVCESGAAGQNLRD